MLKIKHIFLLWFCLLPFLNWSQTEAELKETAETLFKKEQYVEATSFFSRLLALQPKDFDYNYKFGACLLFNSSKKQDAIKHLTYAVKGPGIAPDAFYFLAKAYHLNFQFTEAIANYKSYQNKAGGKGFYYQAASRNIEMCLNGQQLLSSITEIVVKKKTEIKNDEFFRIYDLTNIGGSILVGKDFQSKNDKKAGHLAVVHFPEGASKIFFSSYGSENQKDIYYVERASGAFSDPVKIQGAVNTQFDEDYPYMHPNGEYLYFSSKGHNSMGGYDVFRAKYDAGSNQFGSIENVDFAISSPDDDILYMVDKDDKNAYFASARQSQDGKIHVYEVLVDRIPVQLAVVKGSFESRVSTADKSMIVDVFDKTSGQKVGRFRTNERGEYIITFPKGGKYEYRASLICSNEKFVSQVEIPFLKAFKPLKQKALHEEVGDGEVLKIINLFDEEVEDAQSILAEILKQKSDLDVNYNSVNLNSLVASKQKSPILSELGLSKMSTFEASELIAQKASELKNNSGDGNRGGANALVVNSVDEINKVDEEIKDLLVQAKAATTPEVQYSLLQQAKELADKRDQKFNEIANVEKIAAKASQGVVSPENKDKFISAASKINDAVNSGKEDDALALMENNSEVLKTVLNSSQGNSNVDDLAKKEQKLKDELRTLDQQVNDFSNDIDGVEAEIATLELEKQTASAKNKEGIQTSIDTKKEQLAEINAEKSAILRTQKAKANEKNAVSSELESILAITNYNGPRVSSEQASNAKASLKNNEANAAKNNIDQEMASLLANNPELEGAGTLSVAQSIMAEHKNKADKIKGNGDLSEEARNAQLAALDRETKDELQERLAVVKNELAGDRFNETLKSELAKIENYTQNLDNEIASLEGGSSVATNNSNTNTNNTNTNNTNNTTTNSTDLASVTNESVKNSVDADYETKRNAITNASSNPKERLTALQKLDEDFLAATRAKRDQTERSLKNDPENPALKKQKDILEDLIDQKLEEIDNTDNELAQLSNTSNDVAVTNTNNTNTNATNANVNNNTNTNNNNNSTTAPAVSEQVRKQIIETADEYYEIEIFNLKRDTGPGGDAKVIAREERLQVNIGKRISELEDLIASGNNSEQYATELAILKTEKVNSSDRVKAIEDGGAIASNPNTNNSNNTNDISDTNPISNSGNLNRIEIISNVDRTYEAEIGALERSNDPKKYDKLFDREMSFQSNLGKEITNKTNELEQDESNEALREELRILNNELKSSRARSNEYEEKMDAASSVAGTNNFDSEQYIDEVRSDILSANAMEVEETYTTKSELERQDDILAAYESEVKNIIRSKKQASNVATDPKLAGQLKSVEDELLAVQKKRREISVTIGEIDQLALSNTDISDNNVLKTEIEKNNTQIENLNSDGNFNSTETALFTTKKNEIDKLLTFAEAGVSDEDKNKSYNLAKKEQAALLKMMSDSKIASREAELAKSAEVDDISTKEELEKLKRRYSIEVGELTQKIITAKSPSNGSPDANKVASLEQEKSITQQKLENVEARLSKFVEPTPVIASAAKNQSVPSDVESQIVGSTEYADYVEAADEAMESENALKDLEAKMNEEKVALKQLIEDEVVNGTDRSAEIEERKNRIRRYSISIGDIQRQYEARRQLAMSKLPPDERRRLYYQNLLYRGVRPNPQIAATNQGSGTNTNPINNTNNSDGNNVGLNINPNRTIATPIITQYSNMKGLVYRVQIGAFSKPIPSDLFKEFTPVTGEKVGNTSITRYMAGAFSENKKVLEARDQIRRLGYADAFTVAYCDGKRISFAEAVELERNGGCVGSGANTLVTNTTETPTTPTPTVDVSYNEAPGAAKAAAIEQKQGLFFTVQIGVFNKPALHSQLFFLDPLLTLKLNNNQIRYSCGMFKSLADAKVKLAEAKSKGISDAFVTVYYKGARISLQEGIKLLETEGTTILEKSIN